MHKNMPGYIHTHWKGYCESALFVIIYNQLLRFGKRNNFCKVCGVEPLMSRRIPSLDNDYKNKDYYIRNFGAVFLRCIMLSDQIK